jgi:RNA polymerase sigma factor (sigma-70 family)
VRAWITKNTLEAGNPIADLYVYIAEPNNLSMGVIQLQQAAYTVETIPERRMFLVADNTEDGEDRAFNDSPQVIGDKRVDEWSECLTLIGENEDRAAFTRLFRHFAPLMKAFAHSGSTMSSNHADELVQEVMLKVWQKAGAFNPEKAAASTWIYTIARNCRTDMYRRLKKFDTALTAEDLNSDEETQEAFLVLHQKRSRDRIRELIKELPADQAQILAKVYMEDKSHSEVAGELDIPLGTVKSRVRLAVQKLQIQFER